MNDFSIDEIEELKVVLGLSSLPTDLNQENKKEKFLESCYQIISKEINLFSIRQYCWRSN